MQRDTLFNSHEQVEPFAFDQQVAEVFPDMIRRSLPGYSLTLEMIAVIAGRFVTDGSLIYDLGCALGDSAQALQRGAQGRDSRIIAVDSSPAMIDRCRQQIDSGNLSPPIELICADITTLQFHNISLAALNFTLQFIPHTERLPLLRAIRHGMNSSGALLISEKIRFEDEIIDHHQHELHTAFKLQQGYSHLEVSRKREALEEVLIPDTMHQHIHRLQQAGFTRIIPWFQCFNFISILAIR
ncbi:MAG: carboxy-S-adenosyl-L-methionine synthase CmoA [Mariprofundales bacterium]|nr:carboxy-S-adenosyl-L-methionine synthase CmoA [Mariprofundales bacterium]